MAVAVPDWSEFVLASNVDVPFNLHAEPTTLYQNATDKHNGAVGSSFSDPTDIFQKSRSLATVILSNKQDETSDLLAAYTSAFRHVFTSSLDDDTATNIIHHAMCLANTKPDIFGYCIKIRPVEMNATFTFSNFVAGDENSQERHDMVQWIACFYVLGKVFSMDDWVSVTATSLLTKPSGDTNAIQVSYGRTSFMVSVEAMEAMSIAMEKMQTGLISTTE